VDGTPWIETYHNDAIGLWIDQGLEVDEQVLEFGLCKPALVYRFLATNGV